MTTEEISNTGERGWLLKALLLGSVRLSKQSMRRLDEQQKKAERRSFRKKRKQTNAFTRRKYRRRYPEPSRAAMMRYKYSFKGRYAHMKAYAKRRGVEWNISPAEWQKLWLLVREATGRLEPWVFNDYTFNRVDTTKPIQLGNLRIRVKLRDGELIEA